MNRHPVAPSPLPIPAPLIALAGFLAERAVTELALKDAGGEHLLIARETDLPRRLWDAASSGSVTLCVKQIGVELSLSGENATWTCKDTSDAVALARVFAGA